MSDVRVLHLADVHLGVQTGGRIEPSTGLNQRIVDVCARLDEVCETVEADGVHAVLFAGDAFNNQHPNPTLQSLFAARVRRMARAGASVFLLIGNHDLPKMAGFAHPFSIYEVLEVEGVVVGDKARVYNLPLRSDAPAPALQVAALPHFSRHQVLARLEEATDDPDAMIEDLIARTVEELGSHLDASLPAVFVGHCHVNQADVGSGHSLFGVSDVEVSLSSLTSGHHLPYYALGHVHKHQVLADDPFVAYPGSLERVDFGEGTHVTLTAAGAVKHREAEAKGFYRFDLERRDDLWSLASSPRFRPVAARSFVTLDLGGVPHGDAPEVVMQRLEAIRAADVRFEDAFVRVSATIDDINRSRVATMLVRDAIPEAYEVRTELSSDGSPALRDPRFARRMSEADALDAYLESRDDWADDREEMKRVGRELIAEVLR